MKVSLIAALTLLTPAVALAGSSGPIGKWRTGDGAAQVQIKTCSIGLCGSSGAAADGGGTDDNNPNPALRGRKLIGLPILSLRQTAENLWSGDVYNAQNGQNYNARLTVKSETAIQIEGCVEGTNVCGAETWTRSK
jgi:uncharacterized protein (DUF2147 family)